MVPGDENTGVREPADTGLGDGEANDIDARHAIGDSVPHDDDPPLADDELPAQQLADLHAEISTLRDEILRARAEADNVRKRAVRDVEAAHKYALERFIAELLPVRDSLDSGESVAGNADAASLQEGITLTLKLLTDAMDKAGVRAIDPLGEKFDPEFHQAMTMQEDPDATPGTVLRVMQKGYLLNDRLVRPAMVIVARASAPPDA